MSKERNDNYLTSPRGRPTRDTVSEAVGFRAPVRFAEFVGQIYDFAGSDPELCDEAFLVTLGLYAGGADCRYSSTPPELFPIGSTGCDGDHYGFLLHAPEWEWDDLPLAHYCPMDSDGVCLVGSHTEAGIASLLATHLSYDFIDDDEKDRLRQVAAASQITPRLEEEPAISIPAGWRLLPSVDGVGTLAPEQLFDPQPVVEIDSARSPDLFVEAAEAAIRHGHLATALHYLREGLWHFSHANPMTLGERMVDVYRQMHREPLAEDLSQTMQTWPKLAEELSEIMQAWHSRNEK